MPTDGGGAPPFASVRAAAAACAVARERCSRVQDSAFDTLEGAYMGREDTRGVSRALVTKSALASVELRAAAEKLEGEAHSHTRIS